MIDIFSYRSLTNAVNKIKTRSTFLTDLFFSNRVPTHPTDSFDFEVVTSKDRVATFSDRYAKVPHNIKGLSRTVQRMSIPRTYEARPFTADELSSFTPNLTGSIYIGSAAEIAANAQRAILQEIAQLQDRVVGLRELMTAQAITTGIINITVDGVTRTCEFGYSAGTHTTTLTGTSRWGQSAADIVGNFATWKKTVVKRTGMARLACVMGSNAFLLFRKDASVLKQLDNNNNRVGAIDMSQVSDVRLGAYRGMYDGCEIYEYEQEYQDANDATQQYFDTNQVVMGALNNPNNRMHFGPIYRIGDNGQALTISNEFLLYPVINASKTEVSWEMEQKSIPAIHEPNAFFSAIVA